MAELEHASFIRELPDAPPQGCDRLYYGAEFCFWRLPSIQQICCARDWAHSHGVAFTLVTPVLGEEERQKLALALRNVLPKLSPADEVLISDWGALDLVREVRSDLEIILGRALSGQKRGPRILDMELTREQQDYFQRGSWYGEEAVRLLAEQGIKRIEQDNLLQGLAPLPAALSGSLHLPYAMVTSSRNCPFREEGDFGPCAVHCGKVFTLKSAETEVLLYQDGNTQFLKNDNVPDNLENLGVDRIVFSPEM